MKKLPIYEIFTQKLPNKKKSLQDAIEELEKVRKYEFQKVFRDLYWKVGYYMSVFLEKVIY